jgi:Ribulose-5-phosphate 4-epimerase and related epimerases and aldolases
MEQYQGIKFKVRFLDERVQNYPILDELIGWGEKLSKLGCIPTYPHPNIPDKISSAGNLSTRIGDWFIITAAGSNLGALTYKNFVEIIDVNIPSRQIDVKGVEEPSSETMLHYSIYQKRHDVQVIFHGHNKQLLAQCSRLGLKSTKKWYPYGTLELMESVCEVLGKDDTILIMKDHGFLSFGKTCQQAGENIIQVLTEMEKT